MPMLELIFDHLTPPQEQRGRESNGTSRRTPSTVWRQTNPMSTPTSPSSSWKAPITAQVPSMAPVLARTRASNPSVATADSPEKATALSGSRTTTSTHKGRSRTCEQAGVLAARRGHRRPLHGSLPFNPHHTTLHRSLSTRSEQRSPCSTPSYEWISKTIRTRPLRDQKLSIKTPRRTLTPRSMR